jgi:uncharacterized protein (DUF2336 family)
MSAETAMLPDLELALAHIPVAKYVETARRVVDFFLAGAGQFNEEHVGLFDRVLGRMIWALDDQARVELARRLAPLRNAPPGLIRRLAVDPEITVAAPVLARSLRLSDDDLWAVAASRGPAHQLVISGRPSLSTAVTEVLVECGDRDVVRNLALNQAARLSATGMATLMKRAGRDAILAEKMVLRPDVPRDLVRHLVANAPEDVRVRLLAVMRPELRAAVMSVAAGNSPDLAGGVEDSDAWRKVRALQLAGRLGEAEVLAFAQSGRRHETAAALAMMCDMSIDVVRQLMCSRQPEAALIVCQAAGLGWPAAQAIVRASSGKPIKPDAGLDRLSPEAAQQIVGVWCAAA